MEVKRQKGKLFGVKKKLWGRRIANNNKLWPQEQKQSGRSMLEADYTAQKFSGKQHLMHDRVVVFLFEANPRLAKSASLFPIPPFLPLPHGFLFYSFSDLLGVDPMLIIAMPPPRQSGGDPPAHS